MNQILLGIGNKAVTKSLIFKCTDNYEPLVHAVYRCVVQVEDAYLGVAGPYLSHYIIDVIQGVPAQLSPVCKHLDA